MLIDSNVLSANRNDFRKISFGTLIFSTLLLFFSLLIIYHQSNTGNSILNVVVAKFRAGFKGISLKLITLTFLIPSILLWSGKKKISDEVRYTYMRWYFLTIIFYLILTLLEFYYAIGIWGLVANILIYFLIIYFGTQATSIVVKDLKNDRNNILESQYDQDRELKKSDVSVNIPYVYVYKGKERQSYINVTNPFRASIIAGTPGSGKSFAIIEEYMRQMTSNAFTGILYDFKFPTLTTTQYNYMRWYHDSYLKKYGIKPKLIILNFDNPEYSHRCNPVNADMIQKVEDSRQAVETFLLNINKTWGEKEGEFFTDSAITFTQMLLWLLKVSSDKYKINVCSIPHLITLYSYPATEFLFFMFGKIKELKPIVKVFLEAFEKGANEQTAGQVSSAGLAITKINSPAMNFILTGNDFSLQINDINSPKVLCIGNNPNRRDVYSAPIGLIVDSVLLLLNKKAMAKNFIILDELPTIYLRNLGNAIETGRSNGLATVIGLQTFTQLENMYGENTAKALMGVIGSRISGQLWDNDAEIMSESIGEQKVVNDSYSYNQDNEVTLSQGVQMNKVVSKSVISQLPQGWFTGVTSDEFNPSTKDIEENKTFLGKVSAPLLFKKNQDNYKLDKIYDFRNENYEQEVQVFKNSYKNFINEIANLLSKKNKEEINELVDQNMSLQLHNYFHHEIDSITDSQLEEIFQTLNLKDLIRRYNQSCSTSDEWYEVMINSIEEGIERKQRDDFLNNYNKKIEEECYMTLAFNIVDHDLLSDIRMESFQKFRNPTINAFRKTYNESLNSKTKEMFFKFCVLDGVHIKLYAFLGESDSNEEDVIRISNGIEENLKFKKFNERFDKLKKEKKISLIDENMAIKIISENLRDELF